MLRSTSSSKSLTTGSETPGLECLPDHRAGKPEPSDERAFTRLAQFLRGPLPHARGHDLLSRQHQEPEARVSGRADRSSAYAELVSGLLEARHDAASARFDVEVAAAEADGRIDERTARVLRWWQRE